MKRWTELILLTLFVVVQRALPETWVELDYVKLMPLQIDVTLTESVMEKCLTLTILKDLVFALRSITLLLVNLMKNV
jgi:hypothetical protein